MNTCNSTSSFELSTRSILEGITFKYNPTQIFLITSNDEIKK